MPALPRLVLIGLVATLLFHREAAVGAAGDQPGLPFARLFDAGTSWPEAPTGKALADRTGWTLVPEDNVSHKFQGDILFLNDKLTVVLRTKGPGAEVYSQTAGGLRSRAVLMALPLEGTSVTGLSSVQIVENTPAAVMLKVTFATTGGGPCTAAFRLTTGSRIVEMRAGEAAQRLFVWCRSRWVVVPDFFGDDMVFDPRRMPLSRTGLPTENFLLNLVRGGDAMVMCVWLSNMQDCYALAGSDEQGRAINGCEIGGARDKPLWVAFLESPHLWHEQTISAGAGQSDVVLDWKPPFAAKWRADFVQPDGITQSWFFREPDAPREASGEENQTAQCPCWFDADRALVRIPPCGETGSPAGRESQPVVVYPLDRTRATPLTAFCPTDVIRNTLGVGPCQYILQTEGLATETNPTPDAVMTFVERQFERGRENEAGEEIRELLQQMTEHVEHAQARIDAYADLARRMRAILPAKAEDGASSDTVEALGRTVDRLDEIIATNRQAAEPVRRARELADKVAGLIGQADVLAECQRLGGELRRIGADQDRTLSQSRMTVRWLRQQATTAAWLDPNAKETAKTVRTATEHFLQK